MEAITKKVTINVQQETLDRIDGYAKEMSISRSAACMILFKWGLDVIQEIADVQRQRKEERFEYHREKYGVEDYSLLT